MEADLFPADISRAFLEYCHFRETFPYYGIGKKNCGNWIFQPFSTIFPKYFHSNEEVQHSSGLNQGFYSSWEEFNTSVHRRNIFYWGTRWGNQETESRYETEGCHQMLVLVHCNFYHNVEQFTRKCKQFLCQANEIFIRPCLLSFALFCCFQSCSKLFRCFILNIAPRKTCSISRKNRTVL